MVNTLMLRTDRMNMNMLLVRRVFLITLKVPPTTVRHYDNKLATNRILTTRSSKGNRLIGNHFPKLALKTFVNGVSDRFLDANFDD